MLAGVCMASDKPLLRDVRDILSARNLARILLGYRFFEQVDWEFCFFWSYLLAHIDLDLFAGGYMTFDAII